MKSLPMVLGSTMIGMVIGWFLASSRQESIGNEVPEVKRVTSRSGGVEKPRKREVSISQRENSTLVSDDEPVSIPAISMKSLLRKELSSAIHYEVDAEGKGIASRLGTAFSLLGASDQERVEMLTILAEMSTDIRQIELQRVRVSTTKPTSIQLDLSEMEEPVRSIVMTTQKRLLATMPGIRGRLLVDCAPWADFYFNDGLDRTGKTVNLTLRWLGEDRWLVGGDSGANEWNLLPHRYETDYPANEIFSARWKPFLEGLRIAPIGRPQ